MVETFDDVFAAFGGPAKMAGAIGIEPFHAQTMKTRGSIPAQYWLRVVASAVEIKRHDITFERLAELAEQRARDAKERGTPEPAQQGVA